MKYFPEKRIDRAENSKGFYNLVSVDVFVGGWKTEITIWSVTKELYFRFPKNKSKATVQINTTHVIIISASFNPINISGYQDYKNVQWNFLGTVHVVRRKLMKREY